MSTSGSVYLERNTPAFEIKIQIPIKSGQIFRNPCGTEVGMISKEDAIAVRNAINKQIGKEKPARKKTKPTKRKK